MEGTFKTPVFPSYCLPWMGLLLVGHHSKSNSYSNIRLQESQTVQSGGIRTSRGLIPESLVQTRIGIRWVDLPSLRAR